MLARQPRLANSARRVGPIRTLKWANSAR